jgi:ATP-binding cassette subfamily B protein
MAAFPNLRRMLAFLRPHWKWIALSQVFILLSAVFTVLIPAELSRLINVGIGTSDIGVVVDSSLTMLLYAIIAAGFIMANLVVAVKIAEGAGNYLRTQVYRNVQQYSFRNLDTFPAGELMIRLTNDITQINMAVQLSIRFLLLAPFMIVIALILVGISSPDLLWIIILAIPAAGLLFGGTGILLQKGYKVRQNRLGQMNTTLQEALSGIRVVKAFVRQGHENKRFDDSNQSLYLASLVPQQIIAFIIPGVFLILGLANAAAIWFGGTEIIAGTGMEIGELMAFSQYFFLILAQMFLLSLVFPQIIAAEASAGRLAELIDTRPAIQDAPGAVPLDTERVKGRIVFEDVTFSYEGRGGAPAISGISLMVEPGKTVAFLGPTGSGKSTVVNLVPRFYDVTEGRITIDGTDVRDITQESLRKAVLPALQASILFSGTLRENVSFGKPEADEDEIIEAAKAADAHGFISAIPEGYDARVARKGSNFSGGQRQRISIARAITPRPKVIILDDSTSAVDVSTESRIQAAMGKVLAGTTQLVVAQRISTVLTADTIVLMDGGKIVASGSHRELMETSPLYREIFDSQLGGVRKEDVA